MTAKTTAAKAPNRAKTDYSNGQPLTAAQVRGTKGKAAKATAERAPRAKKDGLRAGQVRILAVLAKHNNKTRRELAELAKVTTGWAFNHIGPTEGNKRATTEARTGYPCLLSLGMVRSKVIVIDVEDDKSSKVRVYEITAAGRKALAKAEK